MKPAAELREPKPAGLPTLSPSGDVAPVEFTIPLPVPHWAGNPLHDSPDTQPGVRMGLGKLTPTGRLVAAGLAASGPLAAAASVYLSGKDLVAGPVVCPLRLMTGVPCPFCGSTTSFAHLGGMRFREAFLANPAGPVLFTAIVVAALVGVAAAATGRRPLLVGRLSRWLVWAVRLAVVAAVAMMWFAELVRFSVI